MHPGSEETLVTVLFIARGNDTEVVLTHSGFATEKIREDHKRGWNGSFDVLGRTIKATTDKIG